MAIFQRRFSVYLKVIYEVTNVPKIYVQHH
jgi:hypothetical protein